MTLSIILLSILSLSGWTARQADMAEDSRGYDANSVDTRITVFTDSVTAEADAETDDPGIDVPAFINRDKNRIEMNGADWSRPRASAANASVLPFSILHLGDSHIQADIATATLRDLLQYDYGNAGRGLVTPLKMASTNQPWDYTLTSKTRWQVSKMLKKPWHTPVGFTGVALEPLSENPQLTVTTKEDGDTYNPFNTLTIFHDGPLTVSEVTDGNGNNLAFTATPSTGGTQVELVQETTSATVTFDGNRFTIDGINLSGGRPGVFYHTIGNNGATYASYSQLADLGEGISHLRPDLIIVSMGTNEAFGRFNRESFMRSLDKVVTDIRRANPTTPILLTTPMECQKNTYSKPTGKKGRRKVTRVSAANEVIAEVRKAIIDYGRSHHLATYDWYDVAGGAGASTEWIANGLFSNDRVHHSVKGYRLQGFLLYEALKNSLSTNSLLKK